MEERPGKAHCISGKGAFGKDVPTLPETHTVFMYKNSVGKTQKIPTNRSARARLARR
jgi:hypothetical protein